MDSEGSEVDDLADLDLATFARPEGDDTKFGTKATDADCDRLTEMETDRDSLGDSMDSRVSSEIMQVSGFSISSGHSFSNADDVNISRETNSHNYNSSDDASNSCFGSMAQDQIFDDSVASNAGGEVTDFGGSTRAPGRPGVFQHYVSLQRLPGENLGMVLAIEGDQDNRRPVEAVLVRSVTPGGAAARAGEGGNSVRVGDEVREVDGRPLTELTHDQCIALFQDMPDHAVLTIHREAGLDQPAPGFDSAQPGYPSSSTGAPTPIPRPRGKNGRGGSATKVEPTLPKDSSALPRPDDDEGVMRTPRGFVKLDVTVFRGEEDSLGLSIIPSHGATCDLYQVKRLLPGGACAESGCLEVHDRLLYCNGLSLKGLTQAQCLQVLKSSGHFVELTVLRQIDASSGQQDDSPKEAAPSVSPDHPTHRASSEGDPAVAIVEDEVLVLHTRFEESVPQEYLSDAGGADFCSPESQQTALNADSQAPSVELVHTTQISDNPPHSYAPGTEGNIKRGDGEQTEEWEYPVHDDHPVVNVRLEAEEKTDTFIGALISLAGQTEERPDSEVEEPPHSSTIENQQYSNPPVIPPPLEFSDTTIFAATKQPAELPLTQSYDQPEACITNIDDILFDVNESSTHDHTEVSEELLEVPLEVNVEAKREFSVEGFTGNTVEEFAEECFNSIECDSDQGGRIQEKLTEDTTQDDEVEEQLSERSAPETLQDFNAETKQHISTISVSSTEVTQEPSQTNVTTIFVSSASPANITHTNIVSNSSDFEYKTSIPADVAAEEEKVDYPDWAASTETRPTLPVCSPSSDVTSSPAIMSGEEHSESFTHTTMGVSTGAQNGEEEELIQPMTAVRNAQGKIFIIEKSDLPMTESGGSEPVLVDAASDELEHVVFTITSTTKNESAVSAEEETSQPIEEEETIVPEKVDRAQTQAVIKVLENWTNHDTSNAENSIFEEAVTHFKMVKSNVPDHATAVSTIGVTQSGSDDDDKIQPMSVEKDHQGKPYCVPLTESDLEKKSNAHEVDEAARHELAEIMAAHMASESLPPDTHSTDENLAEEVEVIPVVRTRDQQSMPMSYPSNETPGDDTKNADSTETANESEETTIQDYDTLENVVANNIATCLRESEGHHTTGTPVVDKSSVVEGEELVRASTIISVQSSPKQVADSSSFVIAQDKDLSPTETKKSEGFLSAVRTFESGAKEQSPRQLPSALKPKVKESADVHRVVSKFENPSSVSQQSEQVTLRPKSTQSTDFKAKIKSFQAQENAASAVSRTFVSSARPKSMLEVSSSSSARMNQLQKPFNPDKKLSPALRPHVSLRPVSVSSMNSRPVSTGSQPFSGDMFSGSRSPRTQLPRSRQDDGAPFQVDMLNGILGIGLKVAVTPEGHVKVTDIQKGGPIDKDGKIRVGDTVVSINSKELTGQSEVRVQQIIRLLPRGLVKLVVSSARPDGASQKVPPSCAEDVQGELRVQASVTSDTSESLQPGGSSTHTFVLSGDKVEHVSNSHETSELSLPLSADVTKSSDVSSPHAPLTARVEISSTTGNPGASGQQLAAPVKIAIKPTPTPRPAHAMSKALAPRSPKLAENAEEATSREWSAAPKLSQRLHATDSALSHANQGRTVSTGNTKLPTGTASFKNNRDMFEQKSSIKDMPTAKPKLHLKTEAQVLTTSNTTTSSRPVSEVDELPSDGDAVDSSPKTNTSQESLPQEHQAVNQDSLEGQGEAAERQAEKAVAVEEAVEPSQSPVQKTPPPVAPKPRLSSSSSTKSDCVEEAEDAPKTKLGPKISSGYERLQAITKSSKPSKIIEKSRTFVSSKAKIFDAKPEETSGAASPRVSVGGSVQQDGSTNSINTSLKPLSERRKSTGSGLTAKPLTLTQQFSAAPKPNARPLPVSSRPADISIPETSPRDKISPDGKVKSVLSPTRLNAALSPRRASSVDSPTSLPVSFSPKQTTSNSIGGRKPSLADGKVGGDSSSGKEQASSFKYTPDTVHGLESRVKISPKSPISPSLSPHQQSFTQRSASLSSPTSAHTSPPPSATSQISEEHLENTMKMFDDLLTDAPYVRTETDPADLLLWAPVRNDSPRSPRTHSDSQVSQTKTEQSSEQKVPIHPPVAKPRGKSTTEEYKCVDSGKNGVDTESKAIEVKDKQLSSVHNILENVQEPTVNTNIIALQTSQCIIQVNGPKDKQSTDVQPILSNSNTEENIVAMHVSESIISFQSPKEKQNLDAKKILSNENNYNLGDNIVAACVSETMNEDRVSKENKTVDVQNMLCNVYEKDAKENVIATQISDNITDNVSKNEFQGVDTNPFVSDVHGKDTKKNLVTLQLSENLEINTKGENGAISTDLFQNSPQEKGHENIVANNLSKEITGGETMVSDIESVVLTETSEPNEVNRFDSETCEDKPAVIYSSTPEMCNGQGEEEMYREHAQEIVKVVLANVASDSDVITTKSQIDEEQDKDTTLQERAAQPELNDEEEPPPLPGAPPPPLILRNPVMLVSEQDLLDQGGAPVVPEGFSNPDNQAAAMFTETVHSPAGFDVPEGEKIQTATAYLGDFEPCLSSDQIHSYEASAREMTSSADSVEPLNSTGGSVSEGESHRMANSRSPDDMLSEDSGMPADEEFQEGATDDAISPPGEFAELDVATSLKSINSTSLDSSETFLSEQTQVVTEKHDRPAEAMVLKSLDNPIIQVCDDDEDLAPPLPSTSQPTIVVQCNFNAESDSFSQPHLQSLSSPPSSQEAILHGDYSASGSFTHCEVKEDETLIVQHNSVSQAQPSSSDTSVKEKNFKLGEIAIEPSLSKDSDPTDQNNSSRQPQKDSVSSEGTDTEETSTSSPPSVTSGRKWSLRSNVVRPSPVVQAAAGTSQTVVYTDPALSSSLPPQALVSLLEKANGILDTVQGPPDLELTVVHLCRQNDSRELGVDLKHEGGIWFKVSKLQAGGPALSEGGIAEGDWLLAVDSLWCDQVSVMRLLARLTKPKRDSVLVIARGECVDTREQEQKQEDVPAVPRTRPTPAPRPRSSQPVSSDTPIIIPKEPVLKSEEEEKPSAADESTVDTSLPELPLQPPPDEVVTMVESSTQQQQPTSSPSQPPDLDSGKPLTTGTSASANPSSSSSSSSTATITSPSATLSEEMQGSQATAAKMPQTSTPSLADDSSATEPCESGIFKVAMMKGATGVGFCLEGGKGSPKGDMPIIIKRIFKGGPAEKCGQLKVKDEILEVNGVDFRSMRHYEAWNHLKFLDDGEVCITVRREKT